MSRVCIAGCGGNLTGSMGSFTSPQYPNNYPVSTTCQWVIDVPPRQTVRLTFSVMNIETDQYCANDYVAVYDGRDNSPDIEIGRYCGSVRLSH